ncbi:uncharacterized protein F5891DRAFT_985293 [Suillus fuscotomentosus]|uniref:Uncharacterized protein n=1 Tax=Suillus fuscotomentosus TaxID=1912939 RepID=A0AAD4HG20_9AGAM|nr:uncharacterized protein F5891DRAFT_985293 [Suillus fuscotomentosus]KAG1894179.1 hypothetical protein F5891DRAFT_985293 [Suillus fuscotomentosus]
MTFSRKVALALPSHCIILFDSITNSWYGAIATHKMLSEAIHDLLEESGFGTAQPLYNPIRFYHKLVVRAPSQQTRQEDSHQDEWQVVLVVPVAIKESRFYKTVSDMSWHVETTLQVMMHCPEQPEGLTAQNERILDAMMINQHRKKVG